MRVAQKLYEGFALGEEGTVGLISYMRTDSTHISEEALAELRDVIARDFGTQAVPDKPNVYKTKSKNAQEAHEAIRPTSALRTPASVAKYLGDDERRLYELVWKRAVASQMVPAILNTVAVELAAGNQHSLPRQRHHRSSIRASSPCTRKARTPRPPRTRTRAASCRR